MVKRGNVSASVVGQPRRAGCNGLGDLLWSLRCLAGGDRVEVGES